MWKFKISDTLRKLVCVHAHFIAPQAKIDFRPGPAVCFSFYSLKRKTWSSITHTLVRELNCISLSLVFSTFLIANCAWSWHVISGFLIQLRPYLIPVLPHAPPHHVAFCLNPAASPLPTQTCLFSEACQWNLCTYTRHAPALIHKASPFLFDRRSGFATHVKIQTRRTHPASICVIISSKHIKPLHEMVVGTWALIVLTDVASSQNPPENLLGLFLLSSCPCA